MNTCSIKRIEIKQMWRILVSSVLCGVGALGLTMMSLYQGYMIDAAAASDMHRFSLCAMGVICSIAIYWIGNVIGGKFSSKYIGVCTKLIKQSLMHSIIGRSISCFRKKDDAYYLNLLSNDMNIIEEGRLGSIPNIVYSAVLLASCLTALILIEPLMIVASLASALPGFVIPTLLSKKLQRSKDTYSKNNEVLTSKIKEGIEGNESVQLSGGEAGFLRAFDKANEMQASALTESRFTAILNSESVQAASSLGSFAAVLVGCFCLMNGQLSYGMMNSSIMLSSIMIVPIVLIASKLGELISAKNISKKIDEELKEEVQSTSDLKIQHEIAPVIQYEGVSFGFTNIPLFENMDITFSGTGCYLLTGESGCGKSTLIKLLLKYYDGYTGKILFNGMDIRDIPDKELYRQIGVIEQAPYFFNDTIRNNITLFEDEKDDAVDHLIRSVNLTELYKAHGDEFLGDFGDSISGGEKRRLAIARALAKDPLILIFDEPTSGLDVENAQKINDLIFSLNTTLRIVISHERDPSYIQKFDGVIEL